MAFWLLELSCFTQFSSWPSGTQMAFWWTKILSLFFLEGVSLSARRPLALQFTLAKNKGFTSLHILTLMKMRMERWMSSICSENCRLTQEQRFHFPSYSHLDENADGEVNVLDLLWKLSEVHIKVGLSLFEHRRPFLLYQLHQLNRKKNKKKNNKWVNIMILKLG